MNSKTAAAIAAIGSGSLLSPPAQPPAFYRHLTFCVAPVRPTCLNDPSRFKTSGGQAACEGDMQRFVASTFTYRACMYAAIERAIRRTNQAAALLKCRQGDQASCPNP